MATPPNEHENGFLKGLFIGAVIGALLTALFTTKRGREILDALKGRGVDFLDDFEDVFDEVEEQAAEIEEKANEARKTVAKELGKTATGKKVASLVSEIQARGRAVAKAATTSRKRSSATKPHRQFIRRRR